jgi:methionyl-tRNA formyltransferase
VITPSLKVVFFSTPEISISFLDALVKNSLAPALVVSQPNRPVGRKRVLTPPPVKLAALRHGLPVLQIATFKDPSIVEQLRSINADVFVVVAFGLIFPKSILELPKFGCLNLHASLLPKYRGASPIQWAVLSGDNVTGWTLMKMDPGLDTGPILSQIEVSIEPNETTPSLTARLAAVGGDWLAQQLPKYIQGELHPQPQDNSLSTATTLLRKESGRLDWSQPAVNLERQIRAFQPWPGSYTQWQEIKIEILSATATNEIVNQPPGTVFESDGRIGIATAQGVLWPITIKPASKNSQSIQDFVRGHSGFLGSRLG